MTEKTASRFFVVWQLGLGIILMSLALVWTVAHIVKGTMNIPGGILAVAMICGSIYLSKLSWRELKEEFKKS